MWCLLLMPFRLLWQLIINTFKLFDAVFLSSKKLSIVSKLKKKSFSVWSMSLISRSKSRKKKIWSLLNRPSTHLSWFWSFQFLFSAGVPGYLVIKMNAKVLGLINILLVFSLLVKGQLKFHVILCHHCCLLQMPRPLAAKTALRTCQAEWITGKLRVVII